VELSVVIVNYNSGDLLRRCIASLPMGDERPVGEVVVVDNASTDGSARLPSTGPVRSIQMDRNLGFARAANVGILSTRGDLILLLNPDVVISPATLSGMVRHLGTDPTVGVVGPRIREVPGKGRSTLLPFPSNATVLRETLFLDRLLSPGAPVDGWLPGCCLLLRRRALEEIGTFDEDFFLYYEDVDLFWRMRHSPWRAVVDPRFEAIHYVGERDSRYGAEKLCWYHESLLQFFRKHHRRGDLSLLRGILVLRSLIRLGLWASLYVIGPARREERMDRLRGYARVLRSLVSDARGEANGGSGR
jgi:GT2 family glycosyltransferase